MILETIDLGGRFMDVDERNMVKVLEPVAVKMKIYMMVRKAQMNMNMTVFEVKMWSMEPMDYWLEVMAVLSLMIAVQIALLMGYFSLLSKIISSIFL